MDKNWYSQALINMGNHNGWKESVEWGPMLKCLNYRGGHNYVDEGFSKYVVNFDLITLCRNAATHLHQDIVAENIAAVSINFFLFYSNICFLYSNFLFYFFFFVGCKL